MGWRVSLAAVLAFRRALRAARSLRGHDSRGTFRW